MHVIEAVCNADDRTGNNRASDIAQTLHISAGTLTTEVALLEKKGCLLRRQDAQDRRIVRLYATGRGKRANEAHQEFHHRMVSDVIENLSEEETESLVKGLESLSIFFNKNK
jgi:DNA-binding MarR family transcriptional regulator